MSAGDRWAARLAGGDGIAERVAVVVAHPDDETLWAGPLLGRLGDGLLIHLTDGAPAAMTDARRLGFATRAAYAAARAAELDAALTALGYTGERRGYGVRDQAAVLVLEALETRLTADLAGATVVVTHPYEGGHPDHDAAALAVRRAADRLAIPVVEFACYHQLEGQRVFGRFWPGPREHTRPIAPAEAARIDAGLRAHVTQADVFGAWRPSEERWRAAPRYDFMAPPPPGEALYDGFGWTMTSARWREAAARELAAC
ncbi:PIG-L family deacetylase [uncultured Sphingomonas sp.]|uniref:PIG-L family deacetylase n=1 Tax=uncultured Sphingomonas sp. TaxID=158754 RepID=UPI0035CC186B